MTKTIHIQYTEEHSENLSGDYYFSVDDSGQLSVYKGELDDETLVVSRGRWLYVRYVE